MTWLTWRQIRAQTIVTAAALALLAALLAASACRAINSRPRRLGSGPEPSIALRVTCPHSRRQRCPFTCRHANENRIRFRALIIAWADSLSRVLAHRHNRMDSEMSRLDCARNLFDL